MLVSMISRASDCGRSGALLGIHFFPKLYNWMKDVLDDLHGNLCSMEVDKMDDLQ